MTFEVRLLVLLALMVVVAAAERWLRGPAASRWREYAFVIGAGCLGGAFGALFDQLTCTLSPEYFVLGKELEPGPGFRWRVAQLGFQAGFSPGVILGGLLMFARGERKVTYPRVLLIGLWTPGLGLAAAPLGGLVFVLLDPWEYGPALAEFMPTGTVAWFLWVWGMHNGVYAGSLVGLVAGCWRVRQEPLPK